MPLLKVLRPPSLRLFLLDLCYVRVFLLDRVKTDTDGREEVNAMSSNCGSMNDGIGIREAITERVVGLLLSALRVGGFLILLVINEL